jgi:hypothetical protein
MRLLPFSLGACVLLAGAAFAQNAGSGGNAAQTLPVGQTFRQFEFPVYDAGQLKYTLFAAEAKGITLNRAEATNLKIDIYEQGVKTTTITSPKADLYVAEQKMRTKNSVLIERDDMEASAQDCDFNVKAKRFVMRTQVKVLLKHFDVGKGTGSTTATRGPAPTPLPLPGPDLAPASGKAATPGPTDESILPSPGAYSDTNTAPMAPSPTK